MLAVRQPADRVCPLRRVCGWRMRSARHCGAACTCAPRLAGALCRETLQQPPASLFLSHPYACPPGGGAAAPSGGISPASWPASCGAALWRQGPWGCAMCVRATKLCRIGARAHTCSRALVCTVLLVRSFPTLLWKGEALSCGCGLSRQCVMADLCLLDRSVITLITVISHHFHGHCIAAACNSCNACNHCLGR